MGRVTKLIFLLEIILLIINLYSIVVVESDDYSSDPYTCLCSSDTHENGDSYATNLAFTLNYVKVATASRPGFEYYNSSYYEGTTIFVFAQCGSERDAINCLNCMEWAMEHIVEKCTLSNGAQLLSIDCQLRYENYQFY